MFSLKKMHFFAIGALLTAMLLPAGSFAEESAAPPEEKPAGQPAAKKAANEPAEKPAAAQKSPAVVRVNGTPITQLDVERAVKVMLAQNKIDQPLPPELQKQAESAALEQLTAAELLYQEASKSKIPDLDKMIEQKVSQNRQKFKTEAELVEALSALEMTLPDLEEFTRKEIVLSTYIAEHFQTKASVSDEEVKKFYDDNLNTYFKKPESVKASHILVGTDEKATPEDRKKAKEKAEALLKRLQAGEEFAALAKDESTCPSATQGGNLGEFGREEMVPQFEEAAFKLKPGEMSGVVETKFGYHIIKVTGKQEAAAEKLESVKETIVEFLKKQKAQQELSSFIDKLKKEAKIEKVNM
uniref:PpiC-type peptidyl-prolyl cis-trans isomerase n=1 Tax=Geobacter sp. (strain M21) TaxID=443144 RepID=C6E6B4_GEOSM